MRSNIHVQSCVCVCVCEREREREREREIQVHTCTVHGTCRQTTDTCPFPPTTSSSLKEHNPMSTCALMASTAVLYPEVGQGSDKGLPNTLLINQILARTLATTDRRILIHGSLRSTCMGYKINVYGDCQLW